MQLLIPIFVFSCMFFTALPGYCFESEQGGYWAIYLGGSDMNDMTATGNSSDADFDMDLGTVFEISGGYSWDNNLRLEGAIYYQKNSIDEANFSGVLSSFFPGDYPVHSGDVKRVGWHVNGYYDFKNSSKITPFVGVGVGYARVDISNFSADLSSTVPGWRMTFDGGDDTVLSYQGILGFSYDIGYDMLIDVKYSYLETSDIEICSLGELNYSANSLFIGARFLF